MRVNISYSVDLENVPNEIERIMKECLQDIEGIQKDLGQSIGNNPLVLLKNLDLLRIKMAVADLRLDDCMQILSGLVGTLAKPPGEQAPVLPPFPTELSTPHEEENE